MKVLRINNPSKKLLNFIEKLKERKEVEHNLLMDVGKMKGSYDYFRNYKKRHPTYKNIVSDVLTPETTARTKKEAFKKLIKTKELIHKSIREGKDLSNIDVKFCTPI